MSTNSFDLDVVVRDNINHVFQIVITKFETDLSPTRWFRVVSNILRMNLGVENYELTHKFHFHFSFYDTCIPGKVRKLIQSFHTSNFLDESLSREARYGKVPGKVLKVLTFS